MERQSGVEDEREISTLSNETVFPSGLRRAEQMNNLPLKTLPATCRKCSQCLNVYSYFYRETGRGCFFRARCQVLPIKNSAQGSTSLLKAEQSSSVRAMARKVYGTVQLLAL